MHNHIPREHQASAIQGLFTRRHFIQSTTFTFGDVLLEVLVIPYQNSARIVASFPLGNRIRGRHSIFSGSIVPIPENVSGQNKEERSLSQAG